MYLTCTLYFNAFKSILCTIFCEIVCLVPFDCSFFLFVVAVVVVICTNTSTSVVVTDCCYSSETGTETRVVYKSTLSEIELNSRGNLNDS